jgi:hypothetical protein
VVHYALVLIRQTDDVRQAEMEQWASVSVSTDSTDAINFLDDKEAGSFIAMKDNKD